MEIFVILSSVFFIVIFFSNIKGGMVIPVVMERIVTITELVISTVRDF